MPESLLADIPYEGEPLKGTDEEGKETPAESPTEKKTEQEKSPSQEGEEGKEKKPESTPDEEKVPFHKHPRFTEIIRENNELKEAIKELSKFREEAEPKLKGLGESKQPIPRWFANTFGESDEAWEQYQGYEKDLRQSIKDEIYGEQEALAKAQVEEGKKWSDWTEEQLDAVEERNKIDLSSKLNSKGEETNQLRLELLSFAVKSKPVDNFGSLDFHEAYRLLSEKKELEELKKSLKGQEKKKAASATMEGEEGAAERPYKTSKDLRNKDWTDLAT